MARNTYKTYLMKYNTTDSEWQKLVDIKNYPDFMDSPDALDWTTLSHSARVYIPGIDETTDNLEFTCNYTKTDFTALTALKGTNASYGVWFGGTVSGGSVVPDGSEGKFTFDGALNVRVSGKGVNEVAEMVVSIMPSTEISFS